MDLPLNSQYVRLFSDNEQKVLIIYSEPEEFPAEALEEVREERGSLDFELPSCTVQIIVDETSQQAAFIQYFH